MDGVKNNNLFYALALKAGMAKGAFDWRGGLVPVPSEFGVWRSEYTAEIVEAWRVTEALIDRLEKRTAADGAQLTVFYIPERASVYEEVWESTKKKYGLTDDKWDLGRDDRELARICETHNLDCLDPTDRFRIEAERIAGEGGRLCFQKDGHWNAEGHRLAGQVLAEHIRARDPEQAANRTAAPTIGGPGRPALKTLLQDLASRRSGSGDPAVRTLLVRDGAQ